MTPVFPACRPPRLLRQEEPAPTAFITIADTAGG